MTSPSGNRGHSSFTASELILSHNKMVLYDDSENPGVKGTIQGVKGTFLNATKLSRNSL